MFLEILLITVLFICVITDLKSRKIYNKVLFPALLIALLLQVILYGWAGVTQYFIGLGVGLLILLLPYLLGGIGAGDVKLLAFIGAAMGMNFVLWTSLYMALVGGAIAVIYMLIHQEVRSRVQLFFQAFLLRQFRLAHDYISTDATKKHAFPYGVAIAAGAACTLILGGVV